MVVKLTLPVVNDAEFFDNVLAQRKKGRNRAYFESISNGWLSQLKKYDSVGGDPTQIIKSIIETDDKDKLINLYSDSNEESYHIPHIEKLRRPSPRLPLCPACGEEGTPNTLDHYLPKNIFPEFSIHLKNLVPMCDVCQGIKRESFVDSMGHRKYLHPYFDAIDQPLMSIRIEPPFSSPRRFELQVNPLLSTALAVQVTRHLNGLGLSVRLEDYCRSKYIQLLRYVTYNRSHSAQDLNVLLMGFLFMAEQTSINSWPATFYRSVIENADLMDYLRHGVLPDNLEF